MDIHRARPEQAPILSALAFASKASWGYDALSMERFRDELTVSAVYIDAHPVYVAVSDGDLLGFHALADVNPEGEVLLDFLFINPETQGRGVGRALFHDAVSRAAALGASWLLIESDPHAEGFYRRMGAEPAGQVRSRSASGRILPRLRFRISGRPPNH